MFLSVRWVYCVDILDCSCAVDSFVREFTMSLSLKVGVLSWTIQAGLLTPLTFAQHRLSPLAAFTSGAYFLHNGRR